jgi:hypothetical protein
MWHSLLLFTTAVTHGDHPSNHVWLLNGYTALDIDRFMHYMLFKRKQEETNGRRSS